MIRGPVDAPKYKDYILPLIFLKRLSDVFDGELADLGPTAKVVDKDHKLVRFYVPVNSRWATIQQKTTGLGEFLTDAVRAIARENPKLSGVIDVKDFNETKGVVAISGSAGWPSVIAPATQIRWSLLRPPAVQRARRPLVDSSMSRCPP